MAPFRPQINIKAAQNSVTSLSKGVDSAQKSANAIGISLRKRILFKRESIRGDQISFYKRREAVRRKEQESIIEAGTLDGAQKRTTGIGAAITDSTKGFLSRMMDFVGTIFVGWLLNNLPVIINTVKNLIIRIKKAVAILGGFITSTTRILFAFGDSLVSIATNLANFDFTDESGRVNKSFSELEQAVDGLSTHFDDAIKIFTTPLGQGPGEQERPDEQQPEPAGPGEQPSDTYVSEQTAYESTGGQKIKKSEFGSRGFRTRDGLGSGRTAFGHTGRDVPMPSGTPLSLIPPGVVVEASTGYNGGYGNLVAVKLDDGRYIKLNHLSAILVKQGDRVGTGSGKDGGVRVIGKVGSTGLSTGPHMHIDVGTGYNRGPAQITGLMDPDPFILGGGVVKGGSVKSTGQTSTTRTTSTSGGRTPTAPAAPSGSSSGGRWKPVLDMIAGGESTTSGGYDAMYPGRNTRKEGRPVSQMTITDAAKYAGDRFDGKGNYAVGRYQFTTVRTQATAAGLNPDRDIFSPANQDKMAVHIIEGKRKGRDWLSGKITDEQFGILLASEWAALKRPDGTGRYDGDGRNRATTGWGSVKAALQKVKSTPAQAQTPAQVASQPSTPPAAQTTPAQSTSSVAQISPPPTNAPAQMQSLTPERTGNQVVVTPQQLAPQQSSQQPMPGGGGTRIMAPDPQILLNRFMTTRLLLDLAYT